MTETNVSAAGGRGTPGRDWSGRWRRTRATLHRRRGWLGFVLGGAVGALLAVAVPAVLPWPPPPPDGPEPGTLRILSGVDASPDGQRQALIDQWNKLEGRPKAEIVPVSGGADAQRAEMVATAQAGGEPGSARAGGAAGGGTDDARIDIYNLDVPMMAQFIEFGYVRPLDASRVDRDGFLDGPLATCERDGKLWGLPFNTDAALLYYRSDLLGTDEPPTNWAGVENRIGEVFAARSGDAESALVAGYAGQFDDYEGLAVNAFEAIWAAGGEVVDDDGNVVVDSPEAREGLRRLARWLTRGNPQLTLPEARGFMEEQTTQAFRDGQVVFMRNWPVEYRKLLDVESGAKAVPFGVSPLPGPSVLGGQNLAVAATSDQPRAAQELIEFLTEPRSQQILFERGGFAATREIVYHDAAIKDRHAYAENLLAAIRQAKRRPDTPYYPLFSEVFRRGVRYALEHDGELPDGFADRLADSLKGVQRD